jgi:hypothetical protein
VIEAVRLLDVASNDETSLQVRTLVYRRSHDDLDKLQYELKDKHAVMGSALHVSFPSALLAQTHATVKIDYRTTKECTALQWLDKAYVNARTIINSPS